MYLSIVCVSRNDNYGGNALNRFEYFIKSLDFCLKKYNLNDDIELVLVEWNPQIDKENFKTIIKNLNIKYNFLFKINIITVPNEYHSKLNIKVPVCEFHGKNLGLKNSNGEFILFTNPDIVFQESLFEKIKQKNLNINNFYRCMRIDVNNKNIYNNILDYENLITYCNNNIITYNSIYSSINNYNKVQYNYDINKSKTLNDLFTNASGDFTLANKKNLLLLKGYYESNETFTHIDSMLVYQLYFLGCEQVVLDYDCSIFHIDHDRHDKKVLNGDRANIIINKMRDMKRKSILKPLAELINSHFF